MTVKHRVLLADDHPIVLTGLRNLIAEADDLALVGEATNGLLALQLIRDLAPDVAVVDISMPELNGIMLTRRLAEECPDVRVMALTLYEDRAYVHQALQAGARGYVLKRSAAENLLPAIRAVLGGGLYLDPAIAGHVCDATASHVGRSTALFSPPELTDRETDVLRQTALGLTNKEIARQLGIGVKSVETYKARAGDKLGFRTRADIVRYAAAQGWLANL